MKAMRLRLVAQKRVWVSLLLLAILAAGLALRTDQLAHWFSEPQRYFYRDAGERLPILLSVDGYYYLDLARDVATGTYKSWDPDRYVPQGDSLPLVPPLLSVIAAAISRAGEFALDWVGILLPPLLGVLLAIPVFLLGRAIAGNLMGLTAAWFSLLSPLYAVRSGIGWFDTDILNVTFATTCAYLALRYGVSDDVRARVRILGLLLVTWILFFWWWDQAPPAVIGLGVTPLLLAALFLSRPKRSEWVLGGSLLAVLLVIGTFFAHGKGTLLDPDYWLNLFRYIFADDALTFPKTANYVNEQQDADFISLVDEIAGHWAVFGIAVVGLSGLFWRHPRKASVLSGIAFVAILSPIAMRFMVFAAPLLGLGLGYLLSAGAHFLGSRRLRYPVVAILVMLLSWPLLVDLEEDNILAPRWQPYHIHAMRWLGKEAPTDAVIWASWDHGNPLQYFSGRATIGDGRRHGGPVMYALEVPMASGSPRLAANWMQFYVARGNQGIKHVIRRVGKGSGIGTAYLQRILGAGPGEARKMLVRSGYAGEENADAELAFFFPAQTRPIYLFLDELWTIAPWFEIGRWNFSPRPEPKQIYRMYVNVRDDEASGTMSGDSIVGEEKMKLYSRIGLMERTLEGETKSVWLKRLSLFHQPRPISRDYPNASDLRFEISGDKGFGFVMNRETSKTMMTKLYLYRDEPDGYFDLMKDDVPAYQVWSVAPDSID